MRPPVIPADRWSFPEAQALELSNGLRVLAIDMPGQQLAAVEIVLPTPTQHEPADKQGVATIAMSALDEGTREHPDGRITELMELQGCTLSGSTTHEGTRLSLDAPAHRMPAVMELLAEVLSVPQYSERDIRQHVEWQLASHDARLASPSGATRNVLRQTMHRPGSREAHHPAGTPETISAITTVDVKAWHARYTSPHGATLVLAGDLSHHAPEDLLSPMTRWQGGGPGTYSPPEFRTPQVVLLDLPDAVQSSIQAVTPTVGRDHPDWAALKLGGHALAGAFASRLNLELRERRGLTYGIGGGVTPRRAGARFHVGGSFSPEGTAEAVRHILDQVALESTFTAEEVETVRQFLTGVGPLASETAGDVAHQAATLALAGLPPQWVNEHTDSLLAPSADDVTRAMREHVRPEALTIAVGGPAALAQPALEALGIEVSLV